MVCWSKPPPKEPEVDVEAKLKELEDRLNAKIMELSGSVINDFTVELTQLKEQMEGLQEKRIHSEKVFSDTVERHTQQIHDLRKEMNLNVEKHGVEIQELQKNSMVETVRQELLEQMSVHQEELKKVDEKHVTHVEQLWQLQKASETTSQRLVEELKSCQSVIETHRTEIHQEIQVAKASTSEHSTTQHDLLQGNLDDVSSKLVQSKVDLERSVQTVEEQIQLVRTGFENSIADCLERLVKEEQSTIERFEDLRVAVSRNLDRIENNTILAQNVYSRCVQWNCGGFQYRLAQILEEEKEAKVDFPGIRSPEFSLCSLPTMQLELCLAARTVAMEEAPLAPLPVPGSCSVRLWVPPGIEMTFRITVGDGDRAVSRRFDYSFLEAEIEGEPRCPFEVLNFCMLDQVWHRREDMVTVLFELLEFRTQPILKAPEEDAPELVPEGDAGEDEIPHKKRGDELFFTRSATAELLLHERLQKDLVSLRNKSVRRVEWRLEGCTRLLECCRAGDSVDSPIFSAAGLERIQFHFYPKGYEPATGSTSPCSLFVSGPDRGVSLRGVLWVGSQGRQFDHRFKSRGDVGGRSKFCSLEQLQDPQDAVLLAVDLNEVEQELPEHNQSLVLREARSNAGNAFDVTSPMSPSRNLVTVPPSANAKATMRMKREDPSKTEQLVKCVSLPSLKASNMSQMSLTSTMKSRRSHDF
mgnify:CR=1 FL=1